MTNRIPPADDPNAGHVSASIPPAAAVAPAGAAAAMADKTAEPSSKQATSLGRRMGILLLSDPVARTIKRIGLVTSVSSVLIFLMVLGARLVLVAMKVFPPPLPLLLLQIGARTGAVLALVSTLAWIYHWWRLISRRERFDWRRELKGAAIDQAAGTPGRLQGLSGVVAKSGGFRPALQAGVLTALPLVLLGADLANVVATHPASGTYMYYAMPNPNSSAHAITLGPDNNLWFTEPAGNKIGKISPYGKITEYPIPTPGSNPTSIAADSDGHLWFVEADTNKIGRITLTGSIREFSPPTVSTPSGNCALKTGDAPRLITAGSDGNMWVLLNGCVHPDTNGIASEFGLDDWIGRITPAGTISVMPDPNDGIGGAEAIAMGPKGSIWITHEILSGVDIEEVTTSGKRVLRKIVPNLGGYGSSPGLVVGSDGNLWFIAGVYKGDYICRITPSGTFTKFPVSIGVYGSDITAGPDGNLWFTSGNKLGVISTSGALRQVSLPQDPAVQFTSAWSIVAGPDGNLWITDGTNKEIGRYTP